MAHRYTNYLPTQLFYRGSEQASVNAIYLVWTGANTIRNKYMVISVRAMVKRSRVLLEHKLAVSLMVLSKERLDFSLPHCAPLFDWVSDSPNEFT